MATRRSRGERLSSRAYRGLLAVLFPRGYRRAYGEAMEDLFIQQLEEARSGPRALRRMLRLWLSTVWDLAVSGSRAWLGSRHGTAPEPHHGGADPRGPAGGLRSVADDVRLTVLRSLRRPVYPVVSTGILTLGLAAGIAVFTYVNGFSQPFPGVDHHGLVRLFGSETEAPYQDVSFLDFQDYAAAATSFEDVAAVQPFYAASVRHETMTEVAFLEAVTGNLFGVLDVDLALGRGLTPEDDRPGAPAAAVISYAWWRSRFNGDPAILGHTIYLNYRPFTVVGVAAPEFLGSTAAIRPHVWIPIAPFRDRYVSWDRMALDRDVPLVRVFARLPDGVSRQAAQDELARIARNLDIAYPGRDEPRRVRLETATWIDPRTRLAEQDTDRVMIVAAAGFLLLVCANVANLLLSVFTRRQHEIAMHAALGASPRRLFRQVMIENLGLSTVAGASALLLAVPLSTRLGSYFARPSVWGENVSRELAVDWKVVLFAVAISILTGMLAGILPSARASGRNLVRTLKTGRGGSGAGRRLFGAHGSLVAAQVALSVVLLVVAGLVLRTLATVRGLDPGFEYQRLVGSHLSTSSTSVTAEEREQWFHDVAERIAMEPWVQSATVSQTAPLSPHPTAVWRVEGVEDLQSIIRAPVHVGFFETMGIDLLEGREFSPSDTLGAPDVAVINQPAADRYFPGGDAVGRHLWWPSEDGPDREFEVVGVVGPVKVQDFLAEAEPAVYLPYRQHMYPTGSALVLAVNIDPAAAVPLMERWLREFEPHTAIINVLPYSEVVRGSLYTQRMNAELFAALAVLGLALACIGIFSVMTLAVSRRTREMGVRKAIGARSADINLLVIRQALTPVAVGLVLGLGASFAAAGLVRSLLVGVEPSDPVSLATGTGLLILTALAAAYLPARRAGRVDPMEALRVD